jgi:hypothetical protein
MPELDPEFKPVHIGYTKEINTRRHALSPQKTVRGNVITFVPERTIDRFNMPTYTGEIPFFTKVRAHQKKSYERLKQYDEHQKTIRGNDNFSRLVKLLWRNDYYHIKFPKFFTIAMIRDSLYLLIKANLEDTKFMVMPSQKRRSIFIGNKDMVRVFVGSGEALAAANNREFHHWGEPCLVSVPIMRKHTRLKLVTT